LKKPRSTRSRTQIQLRLRIIPIITTIPPLKIMEIGMANENPRKERRMVKEIMHLRLFIGKQSLFFPLVEIWVMLKTPAELKKEQ
jgi:hypothetical protein